MISKTDPLGHSRTLPFSDSGDLGGLRPLPQGGVRPQRKHNIRERQGLAPLLVDIYLLEPHHPILKKTLRGHIHSCQFSFFLLFWKNLQSRQNFFPDFALVILSSCYIFCVFSTIYFPFFCIKQKVLPIISQKLQ